MVKDASRRLSEEMQRRDGKEMSSSAEVVSCYPVPCKAKRAVFNLCLLGLMIGSPSLAEPSG